MVRLFDAHVKLCLRRAMTSANVCKEVIPAVRHHSGNIMLWDCFCFTGSWKLTRVHKKNRSFAKNLGFAKENQ